MIKKYKQFNESIEFPSTKDEIVRLCNFFNITKYTINEDMSIDVNGDVNLNRKDLKKIPLNFNYSRSFYCNQNGLKSLEGGPKEVVGDYHCDSNNLESLKYLPSSIGGHINCQSNNIKSFKGVPEDFEGPLYCGGNPIYEVYRLFNGKVKSIYWINEYDVIQGNSIILDRLEEVFIQLDMDIPTIDRHYFNPYYKII